MIWILGDNHGRFDHVLEAVKATGERPAAVIFARGHSERVGGVDRWLAVGKTGDRLDLRRADS